MEVNVVFLIIVVSTVSVYHVSYFPNYEYKFSSSVDSDLYSASYHNVCDITNLIFV